MLQTIGKEGVVKGVTSDKGGYAIAVAISGRQYLYHPKCVKLIKRHSSKSKYKCTEWTDVSTL